MNRVKYFKPDKLKLSLSLSLGFVLYIFFDLSQFLCKIGLDEITITSFLCKFSSLIDSFYTSINRLLGVTFVYRDYPVIIILTNALLVYFLLSILRMYFDTERDKKIL